MEVALPTYAATAWYHNKLPGQRPKDLVPFVQSVERFAMTDYALALSQGASLSPQRRTQIAQKIHDVTGLPVWYVLKANLRIDGNGAASSRRRRCKVSQSGLTTGRLDTRFSGPTISPSSKEADGDPQSSAISVGLRLRCSANYVRSELNYGLKP